ncbi:MAG: UDP-N-acetylmuramate:L-alanyl-gamma-D-glutamyl-meso-diaminopimelate ligase [Desulfobacterales bacterium]|nr:UDP-N-acetylmuramate:L-alanyl-gamma-D-glutamyl-meso-diaminopimelate ligase [Desulfobacterales bacterium]
MSSLPRNVIPDNVKKIHLIAVCGTGMGALACMLKNMGYDVTGSDQKVYPPMSDFLVRKGISLMEGFSADNLSHHPDLVIVGNAVRKDNPEAVRMMETGLFYCSMPQALNRFAAKGKKTLLVTGTHGKTTTSSILAWILFKAGLDPSFMIGGIVRNFDSNYRIGEGGYFVVEGDEYDTAFFDKGPKFLHFDSSVTVLTSIEFDHADIFRDLEHVKQAFGSMIEKIAPGNLLIACDGDENIDSLIKNRDCLTERYGRKENSSWRLGQVFIKSPWTFFEVIKKGELFGNFKTKLVGEHNLLNALSVIAAADHLSISPGAISEALETFDGAKRRQEVRGVKKGITVMDDFAHHPTAVRETIKAVRPFYRPGRIIAVFEPRTNSSMRKVFQDVYPLSFDSADIICISRPPLLEKIPQEERFSSERLVEDLKRRGKDAHYFEDTQSIIDFLVKESKAGDLILIMSNGGFENIHERLLKAL